MVKEFEKCRDEDLYFQLDTPEEKQKPQEEAAPQSKQVVTTPKPKEQPVEKRSSISSQSMRAEIQKNMINMKLTTSSFDDELRDLQLK